jgi:hypothetical protein
MARKLESVDLAADGEGSEAPWKIVRAIVAPARTLTQWLCLPTDDGEGVRPRTRMALCLLGLVLVGLTGWGLYALLVPPSIPSYTSPNFLELVFDDRVVVGLLRSAGVLVGTAVAVYLLFSVVVHVWNGRWVISWGSAKIGRDVESLKKQRRDLKAEVKAANERNAGLRKDLEEATVLLQKVAEGNLGRDRGGVTDGDSGRA